MEDSVGLLDSQFSLLDSCLWIDGVKGLWGPLLEFPKADIRHVSANVVVGVFQHGTPALCVQDLPRFQDSR